MTTRLAATIVAAAFAMPSAAPAAATTQQQLEEARRREALAQTDLATLMQRYRDSAIEADDAAARTFLFRLQAEQAAADEEASRSSFERGLRHTYITAHGGTLAVIAGARSIADLEAGLPYARRVLDRSHSDARDLTIRHALVRRLLREAEAAQSAQLERERSLTEMREAIVDRLNALRAEVHAAEAALIVDGAARWQTLFEQWLATQAGIDKTLAERRRARGEAMFRDAAPFLGPRDDCSVPAGLKPTGQTLRGEASWYGKEFAGRNTASGAVFDPSRFTVAHKTLPFGLFLLIKLKGHCVVSFLNDRGPYVEGRILDLSRASAEAVGVHVNDVEATVYVRD